MKILLTGGAGFVGCHLVDRLIQDHQLTVIDNFSLPSRSAAALRGQYPQLALIEADLLDASAVQEAMRGVDCVFHLAANSDIREGTQSTECDLKQGTLATYHVLEAMRQHAVKQLIFTSSSAVYGVATRVPTPEDYGPLQPISLYGASKLSAEGLISAFSHLYGMRAWIFRLANIVGPGMTHGVLLDFFHKLSADPARLNVLGDGEQQKAYLHVHDCVEGMLCAWKLAQEQLNVLNISTDDAVPVRRIAEMCVARMGRRGAAIAYAGGQQGWPGDVTRMGLETRKIRSLGWTPQHASAAAVERAIGELLPCKPLSSPAV